MATLQQILAKIQPEPAPQPESSPKGISTLDIELVRDKITGFLLLWETGRLRNCNKFYCRSEQKLQLGRVPRAVKYLILLWMPDDWGEDEEQTECEKLALVSRSCWQTYQSATRNYLKYA